MLMKRRGSTVGRRSILKSFNLPQVDGRVGEHWTHFAWFQGAPSFCRVPELGAFAAKAQQLAHFLAVIVPCCQCVRSPKIGRCACLQGPARGLNALDVEGVDEIRYARAGTGAAGAGAAQQAPRHSIGPHPPMTNKIHSAPHGVGPRLRPGPRCTLAAFAPLPQAQPATLNSARPAACPAPTCACPLCAAGRRRGSRSTLLAMPLWRACAACWTGWGRGRAGRCTW